MALKRHKKAGLNYRHKMVTMGRMLRKGFSKAPSPYPGYTLANYKRLILTEDEYISQQEQDITGPAISRT
jgi:hypothetical protein